MASLSEIEQNRLRKLALLRKAGVNPYPEKSQRTYQIKEVLAYFSKFEQEGKRVVLTGRLRQLRVHGRSAFANLQDESGTIQLFFDQRLLGKQNFSLFKKTVDLGDFLEVWGKVFKTKTGEKTLRGEKWQMLAKTLKPLPDKWYGFKNQELRFRRRYLDLLMNDETRQRFYQRSQILEALREFLKKEEFLEVETPILQQVYGGATARPFKTHHNALDLDLFLRIAPELYLKRLLVGNFEKIYEINRSFRNEGISPLHNPEFTMLELYSAYGDYKEMMEITENLLTTLVKNLYGKLKIPYQGKEIDFSLPWEKITWSDVFKKVGITNWKDITAVREKINDFQLEVEEEKQNNLFELLDFIFKKKIQPDLINPTFVIDYPVEISPLAKSKKDNPEITERFELFIGGLEVANAYSELNDPIEQYTRFYEKAKGDKEKIDFDYIEALEYGMPPAGGLGIGIDRLVMILTDSPSIREVILFPLLRPKK